MKLKSIFEQKNYIKKIKSVKKKSTVNRLISEEFISVDLDKIWKIDINNYFNKSSFFDISKYNVFVISIDLKNINWHKDYVLGFEYPLKGFDKIKILHVSGSYLPHIGGSSLRLGNFL